MSLFGGRRQPAAYEQAPPPQARAAFGGGARPAPQPVEDVHQEEEGDDLEIPSFLRRLAN
jgi:cell division protein FtsZ